MFSCVISRGQLLFVFVCEQPKSHVTAVISSVWATESVSPTCGCVTTRRIARTARMRGNAVVSRLHPPIELLSENVNGSRYVLAFYFTPRPPVKDFKPVDLSTFNMFTVVWFLSFFLHNIFTEVGFDVGMFTCKSSFFVQLVGRAAAVSSAAVTARASQRSTDVTAWRTAPMGLMRETAVRWFPSLKK